MMQVPDLKYIAFECLSFGARVAVPNLSGYLLSSNIDKIGRTVFGGIGFLLRKPIDILTDKIANVFPSAKSQAICKVATFIFFDTISSKIIYNNIYKDEVGMIEAFKLNTTMIVIGCSALPIMIQKMKS